MLLAGMAGNTLRILPIIGVGNALFLAQRARVRDAQLARAELHYLKTQLQPHLLFNALHAVTQLLHLDATRAEQALDRLATLFRYSLRLDREQVELVTVEDEWSFAQDYLWLEELRLGDRLQLDVSLADDALDCVIPPFTIQPLVENAIKHGIAPLSRPATLRVQIDERDGVLHIAIADTGAGATAAVGASRGLGLRAVTQRLQSQFGDAAQHRIISAPGEGYRVELRLPATRSAHHARALAAQSVSA
jgi:two-component system, LytTR family, sensor kinase